MNVRFAAHFRIGSFVNPTTRRKDMIGQRAEAQLMQLVTHQQLRSLESDTIVTIKRRGELNYDIRLEDITGNHRFYSAVGPLKDFADPQTKDFRVGDDKQGLTIVDYWAKKLLKTNIPLPQNKQLHRTEFLPFEPHPGLPPIRDELKHLGCWLWAQLFSTKANF